MGAIGVPWYSRKNYPQVLEVMEDAQLLPPTYDEWLELAERALERALNAGLIAVKAQLDPEIFPDWCRARGLSPNAEARAQFANLIATAPQLRRRG